MGIPNGLVAVLLAFASLNETAAAADKYPSHPIRVVVPFPAGGTADTNARPLCEQLGTQLGQTVYVDNRAGANGTIGTDIVAKALGDGYTLLIVTTSFVVNPSVYRKLPYDVIRDFVPITNLASSSGYVLVLNPSVPARSVLELIALDHKQPGNLAFSSPGVGNTVHLAGELLNLRAQTHFMHVPYKGSAPALTAVISGEVQLTMMPPTIALPYIKAAKLRALAFTGSTRWSVLPDVPTVSEAGIPFVFGGTWIGLFSPAGTPRDIVERLQTEVNRALNASRVRDRITEGGYIPEGSTPREFAAFVKAELERYADAVRAANIKPE